MNDQNELEAILPFADGLASPVDLKVDPLTHDLVYVSIGLGQVRRIRWALGGVPPIVQASANPTAGGAPLLVQFSSSGTYDPNGDPFSLEWSFGDGSPPSDDPNPTHTYTALGTFVATLHALDFTGLADSASVVIETANQPPEVSIVNPQHGSTFVPGGGIIFSADAFDYEDGGNLTFAWNVHLIHNEHLHPGWFTANTESPLFIAYDHGGGNDRYSYMIVLTVTDSGGLAAADTSVIVPNDVGANQSPLAVIDASVHEGAAPLTVLLSASDSVDPDGDYLFYAWDFGDGTTGGGANTTHVYGVPGSYSISLTVTDPVLATDTAGAGVAVDAPGAIARWKLDEESGNTAFDTSGHGHHATLSGGTLRLPGIMGGALDFDGHDDAAIAGTGLLSNRSAFTLAAWIRPGASNPPQRIAGQDGAIELGFVSPWSVRISTAQGGQHTVLYPFPLGSWHHVAAIGDGTSIYIYYDGVLWGFTDGPTTNYGASSSPFAFGGSSVGNWNTFDGSIDDVRAYSTALSPSAIAAIANAPPPNGPPTVDAGEDFAVTVGSSSSLLAEAGDDGLPIPPGQLEVLWSQVSGPAPAVLNDPDRAFTFADASRGRNVRLPHHGE